ncbi:FxSxx-COOH system tetratricopeptide repeat protein [Actinoplanes sp. NEAU-A12]|uniref:FxSxx-COOH system tetratricopeptide repeat protein n=1 Tax=Actinoplanes sandaracinus TaxID=3045177 RepID=A0ABT6WUE7_9ACTN|nr:FxSxx-COOH system tetratricopeptide repeat protein [Actinoplanes sandaracinus]MDI6103334.1 FxSxx-COOH system tetratricopeptide repeat protein [Actinoplanes sandaracinus]
MPRGSIKKDPATELRDALITALMDIPFMSAVADRRLLLQLIRGAVDGFPDVPENHEVRLHVVQIVLTCLEQRGGLRALSDALRTMAPDARGSKRIVQLIRAASLQSLMPEAEIRRIHDLLSRAESETDHLDSGWWRHGLAQDVIDPPVRTGSLCAAFDHLSARSARQEDVPSALLLVRHVARSTTGPLQVELDHWAAGLAERLELDDSLGLRSVPSDAGQNPPASSDARPDLQESSTEAPQYPVQDSDARADTVRVISDNTDFTDIVEAIDIMRADPDSDASPLGDAMPPVAPPKPTESLPKVWGDVPQRNPNFTGREALLQDVHEKLSRTHQTAVLPQALHGMGGVGKSQVAIEYVHRHSAKYDLIWWIPAEQESQILTSLTQLALRLKLDVSPEANTAVPAVREALSTGATGYRNWLLIFDNAEAPRDVMKHFPTGGAGKVLVTSRDLDWSRVTRSTEVDIFTREESKAFLSSRNPELSGEDAERLAEALGDLPLAIEQAAAWRTATGMPVGEYLALLEEKRIEVLDASPSPDYPSSVAAAFALSLEKLAAVNPAALQLLQICSFFAPEPISRDLFAGSPVAPITAELDATLSDNFRVSRAIRDIQRYALAKIDHARNALQIHRLVQAVLIGRMSPDERAVMRRGAHTLLANNKPSNPSRRADWRLYQALQPHVAVSRAVESPDPRVQQLVDGVVQFLYYWGDHAGSEALAEEALEWWRKTNGPAAPQTLKMAKWLGFTRWKNGKYAQARELNKQTLALYEEHFGEQEEGTIDSMSMVSNDLRTSGDFKASRDLDARVLAAAKREFGEDDPDTLNFAHNLGVSLRFTGEFERAAELDADTLRRREVVLGIDHEATFNTHAALLIDLRENGAFLETAHRFEALYRRILATFDQDAPATLQAARYLAISLRKAGDHKRAMRLAADTLERYRRRYDEDFPDTIATAVNYAIDLRQAGELDAAMDLATATFERYQRMFGPRHVYTVSARTNLAIVIRLSGDAETAFEHDSEAWQVLEDTLDVDHPVTLTCATNLASDLYALGRIREAYERDTDTLTRSERVLGRDHPSTLAVGINLGLDLRALDRSNEGNRILADTMSRLRSKLGEQHPATLNALRSIRADCDVDPMPL